jgi:aminoglycoside phosphotransferase (APT) family kinase protein
MNDSVEHPNIQEMHRLVRSLFPQAEILSSRVFPGANDNLNVDLRLANPTMEVVAKVYLDAGAVGEAQKETHLLRMLTSETGVPVPRVLRFDDSGSLIPRPWGLYTQLPGQPLSEVIESLEASEMEAIGYEMGRYLGRIHQIPLPHFGALFAGEGPIYSGEQEYLGAQATEWLAACKSRGIVSGPVVEEIEAHVLAIDPLAQTQACLLHGAYTPCNVIVERGAVGYHITGIVEFGRAKGGSREQDLSVLLDWGAEDIPPLEKGLLDGYAESAMVGPQFWGRVKLYQIFHCLEEALCDHDANAPSAAVCRQRIVQYLMEMER